MVRRVIVVFPVLALPAPIWALAVSVYRIEADGARPLESETPLQTTINEGAT